MSGETDDQFSVWQGRRVRLRRFEASDWSTYFAWDQDSEQSRFLYEIPYPRSAEATRRWAEEEAARPIDGDNVRFVVENETGEVVGDLTTHHCDPRVGAFAYGISIRRDHRRRGYGREAIELVLRFYFGERRYQKVTVAVHADNEAAVRLHQGLGFQQEGRLRRVAFTGGRHVDELIFGLTAEEFTFAAEAESRADRVDAEPSAAHGGRRADG